MERIDQFLGLDTSAPKQKLRPGKFQVDSSGDRSAPGSWRPRLGRVHSTVAQVPNGVNSLMGFDLPGPDFALILIEGGTVHGRINIVEQ